MRLFDFIRPKWKHSNPKVRRDAVKSLNSRAILLWVAKKDAEKSVRAAAVMKLFENRHLTKKDLKYQEVASNLIWLPSNFDPISHWSHLYNWNSDDIHEAWKSTSALCKMSLQHRKKGDKEQALALSVLAYDQKHEYVSSDGLLLLACLGLAYKDMGDYEAAHKFLRQAIRLSDTLGHGYWDIGFNCWEQIAHIKYSMFCNICITNQYKKEDIRSLLLLADAAEALKKGHRGCRYQENEQWLACLYCNEGNIYFLENRDNSLKHAFNSYLSALETFMKIGDIERANTVLNNMFILCQSILPLSQIEVSQIFA